MKQIKMIESDCRGKSIIKEFCFDETDYTVERREWVTSDGFFIREFTVEEYIFHDPIDTIVIPYDVGQNRKIEVIAYCREHRLYHAKNKKGIKLMSLPVIHDYRNDII